MKIARNPKSKEISLLIIPILFLLSGFEKDPTTSKFEMFFTFPKINIKGKYVADGRILVLPIQGDGDFELGLSSIKAVVKFKPKVTNQNGRRFLDVDRLKIFLDPERWVISRKIWSNIFTKIVFQNANQIDKLVQRK